MIWRLARVPRGALALLLCLPGGGADADDGRPAFPGAQGFGRFAGGWRGGEIVTVSSLRDAGPGSLRDCAENGDRPRVCVFGVAGTIVVDTPVKPGSNLYIAGQTAPGQGVQIRLGEARSSPILIEDAHDVLIRFLKLRPGRSRSPSPNVSAVTVSQSHDIYLDRLSLAFATDQNLSIHAGPSPTHDVTVARSISAWALDGANHPLGAHSKGGLVCSQQQHRGACGRISLIGNLFAHNRDRNPEVKGRGARSDRGRGQSRLRRPERLHRGVQQHRGHAGEPGEQRRGSGPRHRSQSTVSARADRPAAARRRAARLHERQPRSGAAWLRPRRDPAGRPGYRFVGHSGGQAAASDGLPRRRTRLARGATGQLGRLEPRRSGHRRARPRAASGAFGTARAGSSTIRPRSGAGPSSRSSSGPPDSDRDGMPDRWEMSRRGPGAAHRADAWADDGSGWSALETYLSHLAGDFGPASRERAVR